MKILKKINKNGQLSSIHVPGKNYTTNIGFDEKGRMSDMSLIDKEGNLKLAGHLSQDGTKITLSKSKDVTYRQEQGAPDFFIYDTKSHHLGEALHVDLEGMESCPLAFYSEGPSDNIHMGWLQIWEDDIGCINVERYGKIRFYDNSNVQIEEVAETSEKSETSKKLFKTLETGHSTGKRVSLNMRSSKGVEK